MSYAYHPIKTAVPPRRPRGLTILATLGILGGLAQIVLVLFVAWLRVRHGIPLGDQLAALGIGLGLAWLMLRINWGLWDRMRWAWWAGMAWGIAATTSLGLMLGSAPALASGLSRGLPQATARHLEAGLTVEMLFFLVFHVVAVVELLIVHKAFGIGVQEKRPLWER